MDKMRELLSECLEILQGENWRGDLQEEIVDALASQPAAQVDNDRSLGHLSTMYVLADARTDLSRRERALLQQMYDDLKAALAAAPAIAEEPAQLVSYSDTDAERVFRAFWRRIHTYVYFSADQAAWPREFPEEVPPHFRVHMRTALCALPEAYSAPSIAETQMDTMKKALQKMTGIPASVGVCEPIEGYAERPLDAVKAMAEMSNRIESAETELFALKQRPVAQVPEIDADGMLEIAKSYYNAKHNDLDGLVGEGAILRFGFALLSFTSAPSIAEPMAYACPVGCGCMWRDNKDGTMSLYGERSESCEVCELATLDELTPVHAAPSIAERAQQQESEPVLRARIEELEEIEVELRRQLHAARAFNGEFVIPETPAHHWQGDGEDHLESLCSGVPIVIEAQTLRNLLQSQPSPQVPEGLVELLRPAFITCTSDGSVGKYLVELKFQTLKEMQEAHNAIMHLLAAAPSIAEQPRPPEFTDKAWEDMSEAMDRCGYGGARNDMDRDDYKAVYDAAMLSVSSIADKENNDE